MTTIETFALFYAIFWGAVANVQPKWKAFHWPLCFIKTTARKYVIKRIGLSIILLNVVPIIYFGLIVHLLRSVGLGTAADVSARNLACYGIVPAFAVFGFSRAWLATMEYSPNTFYGSNSISIRGTLEEKGPIVEPCVKDLWALHPDKSGHLLTAPTTNLLVGLAYIVGALSPFASYYVSK